MAGRDGSTSTFTIAHLSDIHCGDPNFVPSPMERAIGEINELEPAICSGDLTTFGFKQEYLQAREYLNMIHCKRLVVIPGNHDSRNVGYLHFEELFGDRHACVDGVSVVAVDSSEPDASIMARSAAAVTPGSRSSSRRPPTSASSSCTTTSCPCRARAASNVVCDAGDVIECLQRAGVDLVLSGHKHVLYAWKLEEMFVVNTGTVSSLRLRGNTRPCYNLVEVTGHHVDVWRKYPFHGQEKIIQFSLETRLRGSTPGESRPR